MKHYIHLPNGDYNQEVLNKNEANHIIDFELNEGCQNFCLITRQKLPGELFTKIISSIENILKEVK